MPIRQKKKKTELKKQIYSLFLLEQKSPKFLLLVLQLEEALCNHNSGHRDFRKSGEESFTQLYRVKEGTFDILMKHLMEANPMTSPIQFKIPRLIKDRAVGKLLLENLHPHHEHIY